MAGIEAVGVQLGTVGCKFLGHLFVKSTTSFPLAMTTPARFSFLLPLYAVVVRLVARLILSIPAGLYVSLYDCAVLYTHPQISRSPPLQRLRRPLQGKVPKAAISELAFLTCANKIKIVTAVNTSIHSAVLCGMTRCLRL